MQHGGHLRAEWREHAVSWADLERRCRGTVAGWMTFSEREQLFQLARRMQPGQHYVEIGVFGGTTVSTFAIMAPEGVDITAIDSWENDTQEQQRRIDPTTPDLRTLCMDNLAANDVADRVRVIESSSHDVGPMWAELAARAGFQTAIDVLLIDGDHTCKGALLDLEQFGRWVRPGGLLLLDDWTMREVHAAWELWASGHPEFVIDHVPNVSAGDKLAAFRRQVNGVGGGG